MARTYSEALRLRALLALDVLAVAIAWVVWPRLMMPWPRGGGKP